MAGLALGASARVETERLALRAPELEDFEAFAAMWGEGAVTRHIGGEPLSREAAWIKFLRDAGHWTMLGYGFWIVTERESGALVGQVGLCDLKRTIAVNLDNRVEVGWAFASAAQGKGYATEAVRAAMDWGERALSNPRLFCMINPENAPSLRVAEKCGFKEWTRAPYHGRLAILLEK
jgi:RimJ/RimL family protein N-acetyltransferase